VTGSPVLFSTCVVYRHLQISAARPLDTALPGLTDVLARLPTCDLGWSGSPRMANTLRVLPNPCPPFPSSHSPSTVADRPLCPRTLGRAGRNASSHRTSGPGTSLAAFT